MYIKNLERDQTNTKSSYAIKDVSSVSSLVTDKQELNRYGSMTSIQTLNEKDSMFGMYSPNNHEYRSNESISNGMVQSFFNSTNRTPTGMASPDLGNKNELYNKNKNQQERKLSINVVNQNLSSPVTMVHQKGTSLNQVERSPVYRPNGSYNYDEHSPIKDLRMNNNYVQADAKEHIPKSPVTYSVFVFSLMHINSLGSL